MQTNAGEGNQNVNENTKDDSEEEDDSDDNWSSNIYVFKFGEGYYSFLVDVLIFLIIFCRQFNIFFYCIVHFLDLDNYGFMLVIWIDKILGDLCFLAIKILEMISLLLLTELFCCK